MKIMFLSWRSKTPRLVTLNPLPFYLIISLFFVGLGGGLIYSTYYNDTTEKEQVAKVPEQPEQIAKWWTGEVERQRTEVEQAKKNARIELDALAIRLAQIQAQVIRLNSLGQRLVEEAKLDPAEFDFMSVPALGGPESREELNHATPTFLTYLDDLSRQLKDREHKFNVMHNILVHRKLQEGTVPSGMPTDGWISSGYGWRVNPFTLRREKHRGIDIAAKSGTHIKAVAAGVVTWSGGRRLYGNLVVIDHGNGYVTRYGHNKKNLVKAGDIVKRGQTVALMGSTGRSTGPHLHFEVWRDGAIVDPTPYVKDGKNKAAKK